MKLKMAPNSLFAVLLRSPWWISIGICLLFVAAAYAWLPAEYRLAGALGAAPFAVIGVIAAWQQARLPSAKRSEELLAAVSAMAWAQFSTLLEEGFAKQGFSVERRQGAADFALSRAGRITLVSARRWKAARHGEEALQTLHGAAQAGGAGCIYVALGELSANAQAFAKRNNIQLMQGPALAYLLRAAKLPARNG
ncbi:MAG TPA: restriction endonuclease [Ramlibacter sp.]|nr:restriction endonuclease [Ramlibacter sp.]